MLCERSIFGLPTFPSSEFVPVSLAFTCELSAVSYTHLDVYKRQLERWQIAWDDETRGRWTAILIKNVRPWIERKHGEVRVNLIQLLSGNGYFRSYLHKVGKALSADCPGIENNAEHTFFNCDRWAINRASLVAGMEIIVLHNIIIAMARRENI